MPRVFNIEDVEEEVGENFFVHITFVTYELEEHWEIMFTNLIISLLYELSEIVIF